MDANHPKLKIRFVPYVHFVFAIFSVGFLLLLLIMTPLSLIALSLIDPPSQKSANEWYVFPIAIVIFLLFSWVTVSLTRQRWGTLAIGSHIEYRRRWADVRIKLPLDAAHEVRIARPLMRVRNPTDYELRVKISGKLYEIPFAEHWLFGGRKFKLAQRVAQELRIPISDVRGEQQRASRFRFVRWMGRGEEWKCVLAVLGPMVGVIIFAASL